MMIRKAWWRTMASAVMLGALLTGCDWQKIEKLEEGVSSEADVRKQFGEPQAIFPNADGTRTFEYTRQPMGQVNYFMVIAADGKLQAIRQVLKPSEFAKVTNGLTKEQVGKIIGRPAKQVKFELEPDEEHWEWRWLDGQAHKIFTVTYDKEGKVTKTAVTDDPAVTMPGGK
jgi:outer membrane protein assembly factor BamE (lipoprotein component of BamABCDE complex)